MFQGVHWKESKIAALLRKKTVQGKVLEYKDKLIGYVVYATTPRSFQILEFAIDPQYQRCKAGTFLILNLKSKMGKRGTIKVEVPGRNFAAQKFFSVNDFKARKVTANAFLDGDEGFLMVFESGIDDVFSGEIYTKNRLKKTSKSS